jgi:hypothetical protein
MITEDDRKQQIAELEKIVKDAEARLTQARAMLNQVSGGTANTQYVSLESRADRIVHGTFSGEYMIDENKKQYPVPANYASKSKLVEGDQLKLTITADGAFVYKQIGPVPRRRAIAKIIENEGKYYAKADDEMFRILTASVTYFRLSPGSEVTILTPLTQKSEWGAIENVVSNQGAVGPAGSPTPMIVDQTGNVSDNNDEDNDLEDADTDDEQTDDDGVKIQPW